MIFKCKLDTFITLVFHVLIEHPVILMNRSNIFPDRVISVLLA